MTGLEWNSKDFADVTHVDAGAQQQMIKIFSDTYDYVALERMQDMGGDFIHGMSCEDLGC